jgi:hypothetical protein
MQHVRRRFRPGHRNVRGHCAGVARATEALVKGSIRLLPAALVAGAALCWHASAAAQDRSTRFDSPQNFAFELRFSPYKPNIDDEPGLGGKTPYRDTFGDAFRVLPALEFDWQALRIPHLGTLGLGVSVGYTSMSAKAKLTGSGTDSAEDTTLEVFPMYAVAVLRADVLARDFRVPLVPYAKAGIGYAPWRAYGPNGTARTDAGAVGKGQSFGLHLAAGLALQLDVFDRASARALDEAVGINHSYLYAEYFVANLNNFGGTALRVGTNAFAFGLAFEF